MWSSTTNSRVSRRLVVLRNAHMGQCCLSTARKTSPPFQCLSLLFFLHTVWSCYVHSQLRKKKWEIAICLRILVYKYMCKNTILSLQVIYYSVGKVLNGQLVLLKVVVFREGVIILLDMLNIMIQLYMIVYISTSDRIMIDRNSSRGLCGVWSCT